MLRRCDNGDAASGAALPLAVAWKIASASFVRPINFSADALRRESPSITLLRIVRHQLETDQLPSADVAPKVRADGLPPCRMLLALGRDLHFHVAPNGLWL